jgi:hypothetical protein
MKGTRMRDRVSTLIFSALLAVLSGCDRERIVRNENIPDQTVIGTLVYLKGWGVDGQHGWSQIAGPLVEKLDRSASGKVVELKGRWIESTQSAKHLPADDQGADPSLWGYYDVVQLKIIQE